MEKNVLWIILIGIIYISCRQEKAQNIVIIGDSHGANIEGWVTQLKCLMPNDTIINYSISGNTIGFNNLGNNNLNTLNNINNYINNALQTVLKIDKIIILLGTNDCKAIFDPLQPLVIKNLDSLIVTIKSFHYKNNILPEIILVTPPPASIDSLLISKYYGISDRLKYLVPAYRKIAEKNNINFVDIYSPLINGFDTLSLDGIHLTKPGYTKIASIIYDSF